MRLPDRKSAMFLVLALCATGVSAAVAEEPAESTERCIQLIRLDSIDILNDRQILFKMRGGDLYLNEMPRRCPGLAHHVLRG